MEDESKVRRIVIVTNTSDVVQHEALREAVMAVVYSDEFESIHARVVEG